MYCSDTCPVIIMVILEAESSVKLNDDSLAFIDLILKATSRGTTRKKSEEKKNMKIEKKIAGAVGFWINGNYIYQHIYVLQTKHLVSLYK